MPSSPDAVRRYHDGTKHNFRQFARSLGYLDWASQPNPFRSFDGAPVFPLFPAAAADGSLYAPRAILYDRLFEPSDRVEPIGAEAIGDLLRHALGLSAWKQIRREPVGSRWSLRCNPSSGNLHPTEAYVATRAVAALAGVPAVYHYAADRHALELRCAIDQISWADASSGLDDLLLVALTSIHWRESWKYGERAFRYCQHDLGHAVAALVASAAAIGWRARLLPAWSHRAIAALTGIDRDEDFADVEREEPECVLAIGPNAAGPIEYAADRFATMAKAGVWSGRASQLSQDHVQWTFIDEIARATEDPGTAAAQTGERLRPCRAGRRPFDAAQGRPEPVEGRGISESSRRGWGSARALFLQRRSAVAFDGQSSIDRDAFFAMLAAVMPDDRPPWDALWWRPRVHLALFVHRVDAVAPGLYLLPRDPAALAPLRAAMGREFLWEPASDEPPLVCLAKGDSRALASRLSCDQAIAADGFFSLGMVAEFDASLDEHGPSFYRQLFWETGFIGQLLYLEAEAAGARATGIGCFYDDPVHDVLGLHGRAFQSLYHFSVGAPVEDTRLTTLPGYPWEMDHLVI